MYAILVEAIERKLKLGSENDIPIEEVLIYIENIPIISKDRSHREPIQALIELKTVEKLDKEAKLLKGAKVDMTLYDILHRSDEVFSKLVDSIVSNAEIWRWGDDSRDSREAIDLFTYEKNA